MQNRSSPSRLARQTRQRNISAPHVHGGSDNAGSPLWRCVYVTFLASAQRKRGWLTPGPIAADPWSRATPVRRPRSLAVADSVQFHLPHARAPTQARDATRPTRRASCALPGMCKVQRRRRPSRAAPWGDRCVPSWLRLSRLSSMTKRIYFVLMAR